MPIILVILGCRQNGVQRSGLGDGLEFGKRQPEQMIN